MACCSYDTGCSGRRSGGHHSTRATVIVGPTARVASNGASNHFDTFDSSGPIL